MVLVDDQVRAALLSRPALTSAFLEMAARRGLDRMVELDDPTYGLIEVYRRSGGTGSVAGATGTVTATVRRSPPSPAVKGVGRPGVPGSPGASRT